MSNDDKVSAVQGCSKDATPKSESTRRSAGFHPTIWGDHFLSYASDSMEEDISMKKKVLELKEKVKEMLDSIISHNSLSQKLNFIDSLQRLGVSYHFEREIDEALQEIHNTCCSNGTITQYGDDNDLHSLALLFRLLRQQGYHISSDVFNKFKKGGNNGKFNETLAVDAQGLLSFYEAAELRVHGEEILDEALVFTRTHLMDLTTQLNPFLASQVCHSLRQSLHKGYPRMEARYYMSFYQEDPSHNQTLLNFAKLDFNILQKQHQKEVSSLTKWWKDLDVSTKLPFARDRIVEVCFWIFGVYFEPQYYLGRRTMMKVMAMASIIDDMYDAYGTIEELELFTAAVERWDMSCLDDLPEYMKICYKALLDVYQEIEQEMAKEGRAHIVHYAIKEMKRMIQAQIAEARWFNSHHTPTTEKYMQVATISCGYPLLSTTSFIGMGDTATEKVFKWVTSGPKIVKASSVICRLMDDIVSNEFEQKRGHVASILECYMKENGLSRQEAIDELRKLITDAWKDINMECLMPMEVPLPFLMRIVNLARVMDVLYKEKSYYTESRGQMKDYVIMLLLDPVLI